MDMLPALLITLGRDLSALMVLLKSLAYSLSHVASTLLCTLKCSHRARFQQSKKESTLHNLTMFWTSTAPGAGVRRHRKTILHAWRVANRDLPVL